MYILKTLKFFISIILVTVICFSARGQVVIEGQIINTNGDALSHINLLFYLTDNLSMIAFSISDENGLFKTKINVNADSLIVKISSINYRNES